jgi:tetratricopeptide (TPR) repeat protein
LDRWQQAVEGEGRVVLLTGEAGIGKSRLARALLERLADEPHIRLRFFCSQYHQDSVLFPTREQLSRAAGFSREDEPGVKLDKLEALLARADPEPEAIGLIAELLSLPTGSRYPVAGLTPQQRKEKMFEALVAQMAGLSAQEPVLMLFEDVHWIDPTSLELLSLIIERAQRLRVFLLITARPEFTPPWSAHAHLMALSLSRMSRREGAALVERITEGKALPRDILERILARTDGVPLFVEELTKSVLESGVLVDAGDRYRLTGPLSPLAIPATLHDSLTARLDRLAPVREVAQISACIGRDFDYGLLAIVSGMPEDSLRSALDQLQRAGLVVATGLRRNQVYSFKHALVRDAAYAGILRSRRALFHRSIADALERAFPEVVETQPEVVAHHLTEAGLPDKAVAYWFRAGKNAAARSANLEAIAHLRRGIEALTSSPESRTRDRDELDFQHALGPCLIATQGPISGAALETFARARELCERLGDAPEYLHVMNWMSIVRGVRGELPQSLEAIEAATPLAETRGDRPALVNSLRGAGLVLLLMGRLTESRDRSERAVATFTASSEDERRAARAAGQDAGVASLSVMSWALWALGLPDTAAGRMAAALGRAVVIGDSHSEAYARYYAAILHALLGEPATAQQHAERCLALSEEHGFQWRAVAHMVAGISARLIDPSSGALEEVRAELEEHRGRGYQLGITVLYVLLCEALLLACDIDAVMTVLVQGFETTRRNDERILEAEMYRIRGRALLSESRVEAGTEAQSSLEEALAIARRQGAQSLELRASRDLARIRRSEGRRADARDLLLPVYNRFTEGFHTPDLKEAKALLDELA